MALLDIDYMIEEIYRRMGSQDEHIDGVAPAVHVIERAINDAYFQTVLRYRHTEFEADPPAFITNDWVQAADGTNLVNSVQFNTAAPISAGQQSRITDAVLIIDGDPTEYTVTGIAGGGPYVISVSPAFQTANTNVDFTIVWRRYSLPANCFFIYSLSDITNKTPLKAVDIRFIDRGIPYIGQPRYYDRINNYVFVHPAPFVTDGSGNPLPVTMRMRYGLRPSYMDRGTTATLAPLPEEWQEVVMQYAFAKVLDRENESQRAAEIKQSAEQLAQQLKVPFYEELDDAEPAWIPVVDLW